MNKEEFLKEIQDCGYISPIFKTKIKDLTIEEFRSFLSNIIKEAMDDLKEDMLALTSQTYIYSIEESRKDYEEGNFFILGDGERYYFNRLRK
jgi:hypothetical protein